MNAHSQIHNAPCAPQVMATLYFGRACPNGDAVSDAAFDTFLSYSVTPHFPGFTLRNVSGYWKGKPEACTELVILAEDSDALRQEVRTIAEHYKSDFGQEAVAYSFAACQFALNCWPFGPVALYHQLDKGTAA